MSSGIKKIVYYDENILPETIGTCPPDGCDVGEPFKPELSCPDPIIAKLFYLLHMYKVNIDKTFSLLHTGDHNGFSQGTTSTSIVLKNKLS
jgi:hypothetical protein